MKWLKENSWIWFIVFFLAFIGLWVWYIQFASKHTPEKVPLETLQIEQPSES